MKNIILALMLVMVLYLAYRITYMNKKGRNKTIRVLGRLHITAASTMLFYALTLFESNQTFAAAAYGLYFLCSDFLLLFFYLFINDYTQSNFVTKKGCIAIGVFMGIDAVLCCVNVFTDCLFSVELVGNPMDGFFYKLADKTWLYLYHKSFIYIYGLFVFLVLSYAIYKAARIYVKQYFLIMYCFVFMLVTNIIYEIFNLEFDYSVLFYAILAVAIYYFSFEYIPKGLVEKTLVMVVRNINDGVICIDMHGRCIYINNYAKQVFHVEKEIAPIEKFYQEWLGDRKPEEIEECTWQGETEIQGEKRYFSTRYRGIWDEENRFIGCYYVMHDETEHRKRYEEERYRNSYDPLTGLHNREHFLEIAGKQVEKNPKVKYSILCADIQNFKIINDVFGEEKGDEILKSIANMLKNMATGDTICARLSADRFAVCVRTNKLNHERYLEELDMISRIGGDFSYHVRVFTGICPIRNAKTPISVYCDRAFLAIESIKGNYQQSIAFYDDEMRKHMLEGQHMVSDFRSAIAKKEFQLYLQPQVDEAGNMLGAEGLVRWFRPVHGMMLPEDFVDVFERSGLISTMDQYVWELACKQLVRWKESGYDKYYISVNVSPKDFYYLDIYQTLTTLVECYEVSPANLHLEITETSVMKDAKLHLELIDQLREYGFRVVMDDFGKGYSSLNMLQDMNIDALKIDMEFLRKNEEEERSHMILEMILNLAKELNISVITEGVEQKDQLQYMQTLGCNLFQGYYFAKPMPVGQFEKRYFKEAGEVCSL